MLDLATADGPATSAGAPRPLLTTRLSALFAGFAAFVIAITAGRAEAFVWDAAAYWDGSAALASGGDYFIRGMLSVRGALSTLPYLPATVLADLTGTSGRAIVLAENSLLIAVIGVVIVPAILRYLVPVTHLHIWVSAILTAVLLRGFAPYPMMDLWGVAFALGALALLLSRNWWWTLAAGVAAGFAINLRPAYLLPLGFAFLVWAGFHWRRSFWPIIGVLIGTAPQVVVNLRRLGSWSPSPVDAARIADIQTLYSAYVIRYDTTVPFVGLPFPQQFYCSPDAAATVLSDPPTSVGELVGHFLGTLPTSLLFLAEKVGASLKWSPHTPYEALPSSGMELVALLVVLVSAAGLLALVKMLVARHPATRTIAVVLAVWFGSLLTILGATPETRFALPLVLIGVVGCVGAMPTTFPWRPRADSAIRWGAGVVLLAGALGVLGLVGTYNPPPQGMVDAAFCAERQ